MKKDWGFPETRKQRRCAPPPAWFWALALTAMLLIAGATRAWPQSSGSSSSSSSEDLRTWGTLSEEFKAALSGQLTLLGQALTELETSKADSTRLTHLLGQSLKANESLKNYNAQITERMQERDEELVRKEAEINRLEKLVLRLVIALVIVCVALAVIIILLVKGR